MAIRTDWNKIPNQIDHVVVANCAQWDDMVNLNKSFSEGSVPLFKIETAHKTNNVMVPNALFTCVWISFVPVYKNLCSLPFRIR